MGLDMRTRARVRVATDEVSSEENLEDRTAGKKSVQQ